MRSFRLITLENSTVTSEISQYMLFVFISVNQKDQRVISAVTGLERTM